jgi:hypothetical protein
MTTSKNDDRNALRDPRVNAAWRTASREEPPPALDAAILAAARREVGAGPQRTGNREGMYASRRWWPLAAAATLGAITFGLLQMVTPDRLGAPVSDNAVVTDMPTRVAKPAPEIAKPVPPKEASTPSGGNEAGEGRAAPRADSPQRTATAERALPRTNAPPGPATIAKEPAEKKMESASRDGSALPEPFPAGSPQPGSVAIADATTTAAPAIAGGMAPTSAPVRAPPPPAFAAAQRLQENPAARSSPVAKMAAGGANEGRADEARVKDRAPLPVAEWIALIRRLRAEGNATDAAKELAAFRAAHIDHEKLLPPDLRDWRPSEK